MINGQLGHDVIDELKKRGYEGFGSDIAPSYHSVTDGSDDLSIPYIQLDITNKIAVKKVIAEIHPDAVIHCAAWTAVDMAEDDDKVEKVVQSMQEARKILRMPVRNWIVR